MRFVQASAGIVAIALSVVCVSACASAPAAGASEPAEPSSLRVLALGDSYTIGESVAEHDRWPVQLIEALRASGDLELEAPEIIARTGWTTDELDAGIDARAPRGPFDLVTLLIGVNNQYRGLDPEAYRTGFVGLAQRAIGFAGGEAAHVVVVSFPDWGASPFAERVGADPDGRTGSGDVRPRRPAPVGRAVRWLGRAHPAGRAGRARCVVGVPPGQAPA